MNILVSGSIAYDRIMNFPGRFRDNILPDKIHQLNVSFFIQDLKESFGGTAGNIAYSLALLGERPVLLGNVGKKDFASYQAWLKRHTINCSRIAVLPNELTATAYIITDLDDNQISGFYPGAMRHRLTLPRKKLSAKSLGIISAQNPADMRTLPNYFKRNKVPYIFDPGQQVSSLGKVQLMSAILGSRVLIGNDYELALIMKKTGWKMPALALASELVVTTLGTKGSVIQQGKKKIKIPPAKPKKIIDPTGAGDAYRAGFIKGLAEGWPLEKVGRLASVVAVYAVEQQGTQAHSFTRAQLGKRYRQNFKQPLY